VPSLHQGTTYLYLASTLSILHRTANAVNWSNQLIFFLAVSSLLSLCCLGDQHPLAKSITTGQQFAQALVKSIAHSIFFTHVLSILLKMDLICPLVAVARQ
jgi:hypothetical protein